MSLLQKLLASAKKNHSRYGLIPASRYMQDMVGCLEGGYCPTQAFDLGSKEKWDKSLKAASKKLTYTSSECVFDSKSAGTEKGYIGVFPGIMSTSRMDVDGDILEAKGASFESNLPFLWQHIVLQPVGKALETSISQIKLKDADEDIDAVLFKAGIMDVGNGLGRDTALLIEMDSLRVSHGFEAIKAKPLKDAGWHIEEYKTFEISGVTLPANTDAVFTEFSKDKSKFESEPVKAWLKGHYDARQRQWKGWTPKATEECMCQKDKTAQTFSLNVPVEVSVGTIWTGAGTTDTITLNDSRRWDVKDSMPRTQKGEVLVGKGTYSGGYLPGSWEAIESSLRRQIVDFLKESGVEMGRYGWAWLEGTYTNFVIATAYLDDGGEEEQRFYKVAWTMDGDDPVLTGAPKEVQIDVSVSITDEKNLKALELADEETEESEETAEVSEEEAVKETVETYLVADPLLDSLGLN